MRAQSLRNLVLAAVTVAVVGVGLSPTARAQVRVIQRVIVETATSMSVVISGSTIFSATAAAFTSTVPFVSPAGTAAAPGVAVGDALNGLFRRTTNVLGVAINGAQTVDLFATELRLAPTVSVTWGSAVDGPTDVSLSRGGADNLAGAAGDSWSLGGAAGAVTTSTRLVKKVTGIADNTATDVLTVTIPNANHAATIKITLLSSNGSTDAFESSRTAEGAVVVARTTGANAVAAAAALTLTQIATVAAGATHTLAYSVSAISGAVGASNTFTVQVTIDDSGNLGSNQVVVLAEIINAEATGITIQ